MADRHRAAIGIDAVPREMRRNRNPRRPGRASSRASRARRHWRAPVRRTPHGSPTARCRHIAAHAGRAAAEWRSSAPSAARRRRDRPRRSRDRPVRHEASRRQARQARLGRDPAGGGAVGDRRAVARGQRALAAVCRRRAEARRASRPRCRRADWRRARSREAAMTRSSKNPLSQPATARWWLFSAQSSCASRPIAQICAVSSIWSPIVRPVIRLAQPLTGSDEIVGRQRLERGERFGRILAEQLHDPLRRRRASARSADCSSPPRRRPVRDRRRRRASPPPRMPRPCWSSRRAPRKRRARSDRARRRARSRGRYCSSQGSGSPCPRRTDRGAPSPPSPWRAAPTG